MTKILLIVSAVFWLIWALTLIFNARKRKDKEDWPLVLILLVATAVLGLQASDILNLKLIAGIILACQFWVGLFFLFDGITKGPENPWLSTIGGAIATIIAAWLIIATFKWLALVLVIAVMVIAVVFFMFCLWRFRD